VGIFLIAIKGLLQRPLRSLLTMLTAAIGIAAVVSSISILYGARQLIRKDMSKLGLDVILIENKSVLLRSVLQSAALDITDIDFIKKSIPSPGLKAAPLISFRSKVLYPSKETSFITTVIGTDEDFFQMYDLPEHAGKFLSAEDIAEGKMVCVVDYGLAMEDLKDKACVGKSLELLKGKRRTEFVIKGVMSDPYSLRSEEREMDTAFAARNILKSRLKFRNIYISINLVDDRKENMVDAIMVKTGDHRQVDHVQKKLEKIFADKEKGVKIWAHKSWIMGTLEYLNDVTAYSNAIWIIILAVASIMIITITLVSVRERYHEIAIRITEGATRAKIVLQFAFENLLLTLAGGVIGIGLGLFLNTILRACVIRWDPIFSTREAALVILLSVLVGIVTGIVPAWKAASLEPVDVFRKG